MKRKETNGKKSTKRVSIDELLFMDDFDDMVDALERAEEADVEEPTVEVNKEINQEYARKKKEGRRAATASPIRRFFSKFKNGSPRALISSASKGEKLVLALGLAIIVLGVSVGSILIQAQARASAVRSFTAVGNQLEGVGVIGREGLTAVEDAEVVRAEELKKAEKEKEKEEAENAKTTVTLVSQTIMGDIKIKFVDKETGKVISGVPFGAKITFPDDKTREETDDDKDGIIYLDKLAAGDYSIEPMELAAKYKKTYKFEKSAMHVVSVSDKITMAAVDVSDEVKQEDEVGPVASMNNTAVESVPEDTVAWVESTRTPVGGGTVTYKQIKKSEINLQASALNLLDFRYLEGEDVTDPDYRFTVTGMPTDMTKDSTATVTMSLDHPETVTGNVEFTVGSSDEGVVGVSGTTLTALSAGASKIDVICKVDGKAQASAQYTITVTDPTQPAVETITGLSPSEITLTVGQDHNLSWTPSTAKVSFVSDNTKVATVDASGHINAVGAGSCWITASTSDGAYKNCKVNVAASQTNNNVVVNGNDPLMYNGQQVYLDQNGTPAKKSDYDRQDIFYIVESTTATQYIYTGWQTLDDGKTYYYTAEGNRVTGDQVIRGVHYYFDGNGALSMGNSNVGIDVSSHQGAIDWNAVRNAGVNFAIIRCGVRTYGSGILSEDKYFRQNIQGAKNAGIKVGVYVYSSAINEVEAVEEASLAINLCRGYSLNYPIFIDMESPRDGRSIGIDVGTRTAIIKAFCGTVQNSGFRAGCYSNTTWYNNYINTPEITNYTIWLAQYRAGGPTYTRTKYDMWQYCSDGQLPGIKTKVDMNYSYVNY